MAEIQRYKRLSILGRGAFGTVSKVRHEDGRVCVIKQISLRGLSSKEHEESLNEARVMRRISHPNIISYMDSFVERENLFIVMEYAPGGDLAHVMAQQRGVYIDEERIWKYFIQTCTGLQYLHSHRILHRDLKPQNVFLSSDDHIKIGDLGFGRVLSRGEHWAISGVGTPLYYSPELCEEKPYNDKSDIWALGCLLYELAALHPPFRASNQIALARKIVQGRTAPLPPQYSVEMQFLCSRLLEKSATERPSANQVLSYPAVVVRSELLQRRATMTVLQKQLFDKESQCRQLQLKAAEAESKLKQEIIVHEQQNSRSKALIQDVIAQAKKQDARLRSWAKSLEQREQLLAAQSGNAVSHVVVDSPSTTSQGALEKDLQSIGQLHATLRQNVLGVNASPSKAQPAGVTTMRPPEQPATSSAPERLKPLVSTEGHQAPVQRLVDVPPSSSLPSNLPPVLDRKAYDASAYGLPLQTVVEVAPPEMPTTVAASAEKEASTSFLHAGLDRADFRESTKRILMELLADLDPVASEQQEQHKLRTEETGPNLTSSLKSDIDQISPGRRTVSAATFTASPSPVENSPHDHSDPPQLSPDDSGAISLAELVTSPSEGESSNKHKPIEVTPEIPEKFISDNHKRPRRQLAFGKPNLGPPLRVSLSQQHREIDADDLESFSQC